MSQERQKNNIFITGHTRGIGKAIFDHFQQKNWRCEGISTSSEANLVPEWVAPVAIPPNILNQFGNNVWIFAQSPAAL